MAVQLNARDRVLLIGSSGFVGGHVRSALSAAGHEVVSFDLVPDPDGGETLIGDVRDTQALIEAMAGCDAVLNLAAAHHDFGISTETFESVNVQGARAVCAAMDHHGITNLAFTSSVAVYGDQPSEPDETSTPNPVNDYGRTKLAAEAVYTQWAAGDPERRALIVRPAVVFGVNHFANLYRLIRQIERRRFVSVGDGSNRKSMCWVTNLADALLYLWQRPAQEHDLYNYVDKPDLTSAEVVSYIYRGLGRREPRLRIPLTPAVVLASPFDLVARVTGWNLPITADRIRKLAQAETMFAADRVREAGFTPETSLHEAMPQMVQWYLNEGHAKPPRVHIPPARVGGGE